MVFELHVWGPAFGLPSIDSECIAAIAYLNRAIPEPQWRLIADHDTACSQDHEFPALHDGSEWVAGFHSIVSYLRRHSSGPFDLDSELTIEQDADRTAFASFIQSVSQPVLDLSLYISHENYSTTTAPAYTAILPWYSNYTIPPARREAARQRTAHYGLNQLEVDTAGVEGPDIGSSAGLSGDFEAAKKSAGLPSDAAASKPRPGILSLGRGRKGLLSSPVYAARFRLDALSNELFQPISDLLGKKDFLLNADKPSSLDCLAFGYLSLVLYPEVPQAWLKECLQTGYPHLVKYTWRLREELLSGEIVKAEDIWSLSSYQGDAAKIEAHVRTLGLRLPWKPLSDRTVTSNIAKASQEIAGSIPMISRLLAKPTIHQSISSPAPSEVTSALPSPLLLNSLLAISTAFFSSLVGMAIYHHRTPREENLVFLADRPPASSWPGFGTTNDFMSVFVNEIRTESQWQNRSLGQSLGETHSQRPNDTATVVDVKVEGVGERGR